MELKVDKFNVTLYNKISKMRYFFGPCHYNREVKKDCVIVNNSSFYTQRPSVNSLVTNKKLY